MCLSPRKAKKDDKRRRQFLHAEDEEKLPSRGNFCDEAASVGAASMRLITPERRSDEMRSGECGKLEF